MSKKRRQHNPKFKFQIALEAAKELKTINQLASEHELHPNLVGQWKRHLLEEGVSIFNQNGSRQKREQEDRETDLYEQIGRLKMELEWLKKKLPSLVEAKRMLIELAHPEISVRRQCELIGLNRSSLYYMPAMESEFNMELMRLLDQQYTQTPFYGWPRMTAHLRRLGYKVNSKRVRRLLRKMGLQAVYPKPRLSQACPGHKIYPYLLRGLEITRPNQVWSSDITYVPMKQGFMYLVAIIDWFSRFVLSWELSNTLDTRFCLEALDRALSLGRPEIFNTDQGSQFTDHLYTSKLEGCGIQVSMDGRGRALDNIFVERLWRSVKYEDIYLKEYASVIALEEGLQNYFNFYNNLRPHQSLGYRTPIEIHMNR